MQDRVEPPILLSRTLTFVFAAVLVIALGLGATLYKMFPLNRPQVFFLYNQPRSDLELILQELPQDDAFFKNYKRTFIREYIKARNEIVPDIQEMRKKWQNGADGVVSVWSTGDVYKDFFNTSMVNALMSYEPDFEFSCPVEFQTSPILETNPAENLYTVKFRYFCKNSNGQVDKKDYTIVIRLELDNNKTAAWSERLNNPLGLRVAEYTIESGNGDPLDTGYLDNND